MLDTDQLRSFLAIVDTGSFTRAAERVNKTQSAVSMHVRRLEEQLGCALFVKQGRGAKLTSEGEQLIDYARRIMQAEAGAMAALSRKGLKGAVRLGIPDDYAEAFLADILTRFNPRPSGWSRSAVVCEEFDRTRSARCMPARSNSRSSPPARSSRGGWRDSMASSSCARSRWSGRPPSGSGPRRGLRYRWRWPAEPASGGEPRKTRSPPPRERRADCSFPRISPRSDRSFAPGSRRRSSPSQWSALLGLSRR
jgi:molybdenum-dependent DNA-binding transcriptional regulator ModE